MSYRERYQRKMIIHNKALDIVNADRLNMKRAAAAREILALTNSKRLKSQINNNLDSFLSENREEFSLLIEEIFEDLARSPEVDLNRIRSVLNTLLTHYDKTLPPHK